MNQKAEAGNQKSACRPVDWAEVEEKLHSFYSAVHLDCDGYRLTLMLIRVGMFKNAIESAFVNGEFKGKWLLDDCEERRRFFQKRSAWAWNAKQRKALKKIGKKYLGEIDPDAKMCWYTTRWNSFGALKRHLVVNNKDISICEKTEVGT